MRGHTNFNGVALLFIPLLCMGCVKRNNRNDFKNHNIRLPESNVSQTLNMSNEEDGQSIALLTLGWESHKIERKKAKVNIVDKIVNEMGPKSLTNLV